MLPFGTGYKNTIPKRYLQNSINIQVQQLITDTINTIENNIISSPSAVKKIPAQVSHINRSLNDSIRGIANLQNNSLNNETIWILEDIYKIEILTSETPSFNTSFYILKTNASSFHLHDIYDSKLRVTTYNLIYNNTAFINETSAVNLRDGPAMNLPTNITLFENSSISIWFDPAKLENHLISSIFGSQDLKYLETCRFFVDRLEKTAYLTRYPK
jgi:hypothetical protein